jgi:hypothetical protein
MARTTAVNFAGALQFPKADAATDLFKKEDVQTLASAVDLHDHSSGKGLGLGATSIPNGTITSAMIVDGTIDTADLKDGAVTSAKILDGTIATGDIANAAVTNAKLASDTARDNLLTNGGFEIWQRGTAFATQGAYTADRWLMIIQGTDAFSVSRNTASADGPIGACALLSFTLGTGGGLTRLQQELKASEYNLGGKTITLSMRVSTALANAVRIGVGSDGSGGTTLYSSYHPGTSTYQTLSATYAMPVNATVAVISVFMAAGTTLSAYIDNAMLVVGSQAADYAPLHPADDLARCLRYYETIGMVSSTLYPSLRGYSVAGQGQSVNLPYKAVKALNPSVTKVGTWTVGNCGQPAVIGPAIDGCSIATTVIATGGYDCYAGVGLGLTVESNP